MAARLLVEFHHHHIGQNITGNVWFCRNSASQDPCRMEVSLLDQFALDSSLGPVWNHLVGGPVPCTAPEVLYQVEIHYGVFADHKKATTCYYSSQDLTGEEVWFSVPSPGMVDHAWFEDHLEFPVLVALGSLVLLSLLLGCIAIQGAELYFSGLF
eukprot:CAMPEP_0197650888 /NCGR_PEP_ID=MMETSP1338-20131121/31220_1 /TAXON_ID=43686 ORGANISM="Pelagodinium beii, Strain RCC1491" /NCGR_SAMPLE_ID=MMETSP1338 /ASSEMBLY_ACC=CAM_ASM_000754 /LENGTH=154 /DNA_ID=CAMNT_0043225397 /DNA_START=427 /DNA_END=891 /DNA_ORIENTATION=-